MAVLGSRSTFALNAGKSMRAALNIQLSPVRGSLTMLAGCTEASARDSQCTGGETLIAAAEAAPETTFLSV